MADEACSPMLRGGYRTIFRDDLFENSRTVTGGGTGIGKQIARELLELQCTVIIVSRRLEILNAAAVEFRAQIPGAKISCVQCDIKRVMISKG